MISPSTKTQINSFYWLSDTKLCIVTNKNIEVVQIFKDSGKSKLLASHNLTVYWCKYTSNTNTFVISSSPTDNILNLFRFENNQLVKLPKIEIPRGIRHVYKLIRLYLTLHLVSRKRLYGYWSSTESHMFVIFSVSTMKIVLFYTMSRNLKKFMSKMHSLFLEVPVNHMRWILSIIWSWFTIWILNQPQFSTLREGPSLVFHAKSDFWW